MSEAAGKATEQAPLVGTLAVYGVGLIGGSIAAAVRRRGLARRIVGIGRSAARLAKAESAGLLDASETDPARAARSADFVVVCTPVDRIAEHVLQIAKGSRPGTLITDAGSVKRAILAGIAGRLPAGVAFVGSHPLAGSEKQGFEHADADLFEGRTCVVTPEAVTPQSELERVERFWRALGMNVVRLSAEEHDRAVSRTSHLPHVAAAALALQLDDAERLLASSGFADTTRVAAGDPQLWTAILQANADYVAADLAALIGRLEEFRAALSGDDTDALQKLLGIAKRKRDALG